MNFNRLTDKQIKTVAKILGTFALIYFISGVAMAKPIIVAVIDTGFDFKSTWSDSSLDKPKLCTGHKSFAGSKQDNNGHGTHIAGLIAQGNKDIDYCLMIIKYYDDKVAPTDLMLNSNRAFMYAISQRVDIINYSSGGSDWSELECKIVKLALDRGIKVMAAAGNEKSDLMKVPYYPALCDSRVFKVVNYNSSHVRHPSSNYTSGFINNIIIELGTDLLSLLPNNSTGYMTGTSQATARATAELVRALHRDERYDERSYNLAVRGV